MEGLASFIPIIVGVIFVLLILKASYVKAPPDRSAIISGLGKNPRQLRGKAGFKIPFFERVDWLDVGVINVNIITEDYIPTKDFINVKVDAISQVSMDISDQGIQIAMRNFLNIDQERVKTMITESLQGNLREIIGTMSLKDICQDKAQFSAMVKDNAQEDMAKLGIVINSFNVQNVADKDGLIEDLGIDNREQIKKDASIAKADALRDVQIRQAEADNAASEASVASQTAIAQRENELAIKKANLQVIEDTEKAKADAAYDIQKQTSRKVVEVQTQEADIAKREKEIELQAREAEVAEKRLDAEVKKKAEADKYAEMQRADADLYRRQKDAEAELYEQEKEAEAIKAKGNAEAEAISAKGKAEAEAMDKKAEAMKKYGQAAILEMLVGVLPDMAKAVAEPISAIDKVTVIGGDSNGVADMSGNVSLVLAKVMESVKASTGIDISDIVKAQTYDAKVTRNLNVTGLEGKSDVKDDLKDLIYGDEES